jgi:hypothetical protein
MGYISSQNFNTEHRSQNINQCSQKIKSRAGVTANITTSPAATTR